MKDISPDQDSDRPIDVGRYNIEEVDYDPDSAGTYMIASDMRSAFVKKIRDSSGNDPLPLKFSEFLKKIHLARSVKSLSQYWQMIWELTVACPLPYIDDGPFDWINIVR